MTAKHPTDGGPATPGVVAEFPERGDSAVRRSSYHELLKLPPVSGFEVVYVLQHIGFVLRRGPGGVATMHRDGVILEVPLSDRLDLQVLVAILRRAGLTAQALLALLDG
jgi:hypothetical protein